MVRAGLALCVLGLVGVLTVALLVLATPVVGREASIAAAVVAVPTLVGLFAGPVVLAVAVLRRRRQL